MKDHDQSRRDFIKKGAYAAPVILTLTALPSFAQTGSKRPPRTKKPHHKPVWGHGHNKKHGPRPPA